MESKMQSRRLGRFAKKIEISVVKSTKVGKGRRSTKACMRSTKACMRSTKACMRSTKACIFCGLAAIFSYYQLNISKRLRCCA